MEGQSEKCEENAGGGIGHGGASVFQLAPVVHGHDPQHCCVESRDRLEGAEGVEQNQALRKCIGAAYGSSGGKVERIVGVESVDTTMDAAQTRFFARAVVDLAAIGDFWPVSINPANSEEEWVETARSHGAYWVQNNNGKTDGYSQAGLLR